jgi:hypothetical protein
MWKDVDEKFSQLESEASGGSLRASL